MPTLDANQIRAADDCAMEAVSVPEWGGDVLIRRLNVRERLDFESRAGSTTFGERGVMLEVVIACACDENRVPILGPEDLDVLASKSPDPVLRIAQAAMALNKIGKNDVETLAGN